MNDNIMNLIRRGGVFHHIQGNTPEEALKTLIYTIPSLPSIDRERLLEAILEREALMSTAIGKGIALPHPRTPLITDPDEQRLLIAFLDQEVDWRALDGEAVHTVILIVSASTKLHLHTLSEINFLCRQEKFYSLLTRRSSREEILNAVKAAEQTWN
jgi:PTS system nitrogen regulatory IIA component